MDAHQAMEVEMSGSISDMNLTPAQKVQLATELRVAVRECRDRGLGVSAKWASELLSSLPAEFHIPQYGLPHPSAHRAYSYGHQQPPSTYITAQENPHTPWPGQNPNQNQHPRLNPTEIQFLQEQGIDPLAVQNVHPSVIKRAMSTFANGAEAAVALAPVWEAENVARAGQARMDGQGIHAGGVRPGHEAYGIGTNGYSGGNAVPYSGVRGAAGAYAGALSMPGLPGPSTGNCLGQTSFQQTPYLSSPFFDPSQPGVSSSTPPQPSRERGYRAGADAEYKEFEGYFGSLVDADAIAQEQEYQAKLTGWRRQDGTVASNGANSGAHGRGNAGADNTGHRDSFGSISSPLAMPIAGPSGSSRGYDLTSTPAPRHASSSPLGSGGGIGVRGSTNFVFSTPIGTRPARSGLSEVQNMDDTTGDGYLYGTRSGSIDIVGDEEFAEADEDGNKMSRGERRSDLAGLNGWGVSGPRATAAGALGSAMHVDRPPSFDEQLKGMIAGGAGAGGNGGYLAGQAVQAPGQLNFNIGWHGERPVPPTPQPQAIPLPLPSPGNPQHPEFRGSINNGHAENYRLHPHLAARPSGAMSSVPHVGPPIMRHPSSSIHRPHVPLSAVERQARDWANAVGGAESGSTSRGRPLAPLPQGRQPEHADDFEVLEQDTYELAKSYFESKELERCKIVLEKCLSKRARFLSVYSQYLAVDKRAQELLPHFLDSKTEMDSMTPQIYPLIEEIEGEDDAYLLYLKGLLYARIGQKDRALEAYISSLHGAPYNWSCWINVAMIVQSAEEFLEIKLLLPQGIMLAFFAIAVMLDLHSATELMMNTIDKLEETFPSSVHLKASRALVLYHMRDFDRAEKAFDEVRKIDPFRLDEIEIYSNMLYVMNKRAKLGKMAHEYAQIDKNRAEVCCLIGNYYSARNEHTKAIQYFKRSLQLNRDYLPAWTLMGHEYVEIKNSHAAVESYRRAIDCNPKDYRAWYGLGQTYELLDMPFYAVQYYSRATALRPYDCRMWSALADLYQTLKRPADAIACDYRALYGADPAQTLKILLTLADLHDSLRELTKAADCHQRFITFAERDKMHIGETARSYLYVARFHLGMLHRDKNADIGIAPAQPDEDASMDKVDPPDVAALKALKPRDLEKGIEYLHKVMQSNAPAKEEAQDEWRYVQKRLNLPQPAWAQV